MERADQKLILESQTHAGAVQLTEEQRGLLLLSEEDINNGRLISQDDLDKEDEAWLKEW